jgi:hypothetical protein
MLKFKKFPRAAYRDNRFHRWASRFDEQLFACDFIEFRHGESLAIVVPIDFYNLYEDEFAGLRPGLSFAGNQFRDQAAQLAIADQSQTFPLTPAQLEATIRQLYERWVSEEAADLLRRTQAIGLNINSRSVQRLRNQIGGIAA